MIIESIKIDHFGNLSDLSCELGERLTVISGPNESGKSTFAAFIRYMLYGFGSNAAPGDMTEREKRIAFESREAGGEMVIRLQSGKRYRLLRSTTAVPQAGRVGYREFSQIIDLDTNAPCAIRSFPGEAFFEVPETVYLNTAFISQTSDSRINESEMTQAMENLLFSGDEKVSTQRALRTLLQAKSSLMHPGENGGAIYELKSQADGLQVRLAQAMRMNAKILYTEKELHKLRHKIDNAEAERDRLEEIDHNYHNYLKICSYDRLHEAENILSKHTDSLSALRQANRNGDFLPNEEYLTSLSAAERVCEIARKNYLRSAEKVAQKKAEALITPEAEALLHKTEAAGGAEQLEKQYYESHKRQTRLRVWAYVLLFLSVAVLTLGAIFLRPLTLSPVTALCAFFGLLPAGASFACFRSRARALRRIRALCADYEAASGGDLLCKLRSVSHTQQALEEKKGSIRQAEENLDISKQNFLQAKEELTALSEKWNKFPLQGSQDEIMRTLSVRVREFLTEERRLSDLCAEARGKVLALRNELKGENEIAIRAMVSPEKREAMQKINYRIIEEGLQYYRQNCESLRHQHNLLSDELREYQRNAESPAELRMLLSDTEDRIAVLRRKLRAYTLSIDAIEHASDRLRAEISPRLSRYLRSTMKRVTNGRYDDMSVTNRLGMSYRDKDTTRALGFMSDGTKDLAYMALRMALLDMLYDEKPPICFDESFSHLDNRRTESALSALCEISGNGIQSILFTCHERTARLAESLCPATKHIYLKGDCRA